MTEHKIIATYLVTVEYDIQAESWSEAWAASRDLDACVTVDVSSEEFPECVGIHVQSVELEVKKEDVNLER